MGGDRQRHRLPRRLHPVRRRRSSTSATTCAARSGSPRCPGSTSSTSGPTTRSGLGEDGPTHQPVEHYAALRAMPEPVVHPARRRQRDGGGVAARRRAARRPGRPSPSPARSCRRCAGTAELRARGRRAAAATSLREAVAAAPGAAIDLILIATGSELQLAMAAADAARGARASARASCRLPCWERVRRSRTGRYRDAVLPPAVRGARERSRPGSRLGWERWVGRRGRDHRRSSTSARRRPAATIFEHFGFTVDRVDRRRPRRRPGRGPRPRPDPRSGPPAGAACSLERPLMRVAFAADHGGAAPQGRAAADAPEHRPGARLRRPRRRRQRPGRRLPRLRPPPRPGDPRRATPSAGS